MSVEVPFNRDQNPVFLETAQLNRLEKCAEVFLDREFGDLIFACNLCEDRFGAAEEFSGHIMDIHVSIENVIAYEPSESDGYFDSKQDTDQTERNVDITNIQNEELNLMDYDELLVKHEGEITKDYDLFSVDEEETKENFITYEINSQNDTGKPPKPFEISVCDEEPLLPNFQNLIEEKTFEEPYENGQDLSDEEILRSKLTCKFCGEQFDYVKKMRQHDCGVNKKKKTHPCKVCGKVFKKKSGLDIHSLLHKGEKPHKCDTCDAAYACKQNLIVHIRRHTGEKPFKCDHCDKCFASSTEKISHMRTHTGDKPFVCELCGKGHSSSSQLTEHMHRHLDIRNYACEICDKRFRSSYNLRMHRLTHDKGPRLYNCSECSSTFKTNSSLSQHVKIHAKVKKYVCKICGKAFAQHPGLYSHMKSHNAVIYKL